MITTMSEAIEFEGTTERFSSVYERHQADVLRYTVVLTGSLDEAEEVSAETFERALEAWRAGRQPSHRPLPWLLLIARRIVIDRSRRRRIIGWLPLGAEPHPDHRTDDDARRVEFWLWFDRLAEALTARQREVLVLRYRWDLSDAEIGRVLGLSEPGVRSLASRAIASLRQHPELLR
jgi:RNA polymerase sigma factor (sigma-70 family)